MPPTPPRVFVLGHRGFVGSAYAAHLRAVGVDLVGIDRGNYDAYRGHRADVVINADGSSDRRLAQSNPLASFRLNVDTTLASLVDFPCEQYIHICTIGVYEHPADPSRNHEAVQIDPFALAPYGFFKYLGELVVRKYARRWLVVRLGPLVGPGLRKNSIYDLLARRTLFFNPESTMPYIDTRVAARLTWDLREETDQIFNICGAGHVRLADVAQALGVELSPDLHELPYDNFNVNIDKLRARRDVPDSMSAVLAFAREWREGALS